ncbi:hypothetical protein FACS189421_14140 [Bacteroidia bacterium]|nr:hypothetical protein FACS189421_14140 [Bacteroidia bacterium]GHT03823.1 hypothetical protein FACS189423_05560 [Bacteroidia bacterium]GHT49824.1 hypothetical protein FACS189440_16180 [Bacteroidia bacterium]GHT88814.1 hypothetical protein FACS189474_4730 [Bacteroidia bacterium]
MANPIKETPVLYGEDARRFAERIANPVMEPPEKAERLKQVYEWYLQALERGRLKEEVKKKAKQHD